MTVARHKTEIPRRAKMNKAINQDALRQKIAAGNHHHHIIKTLDEVSKLHDEVKKKKILDKGEQAAYMTRLGALKTKLDGQFKLLNKYLPDLRSIDFKDDSGNNPLAEAAKAWAMALSAGVSTDDD